MMREGILLESAERTTAQTPNIPLGVSNPKALFVFLDVTASESGTGGLQVIIECQDPVSGKWFQINATPTAVTAVSKGIYVVGMNVGATATGDIKQLTQVPLTNNWRVRVAVGNATKYTYSLGFAVLE